MLAGPAGVRSVRLRRPVTAQRALRFSLQQGAGAQQMVRSVNARTDSIAGLYHRDATAPIQSPKLLQALCLLQRS